MLNKFELIGIGVSILAMASALYLIRAESTFFAAVDRSTQSAQVNTITVSDDSNQANALSNAIVDASGGTGTLQKLIVDDVVKGVGDEVEQGDTVTVHYIGTLQNGQEFDNSNKRGTPFTFTVGQGRVIAGWEEGVVGMQVGGQRVLVIPSRMAYGDRGYGPIPGGATLVFVIELLSIE